MSFHSRATLHIYIQTMATCLYKSNPLSDYAHVVVHTHDTPSEAHHDTLYEAITISSVNFSNSTLSSTCVPIFWSRDRKPSQSLIGVSELRTIPTQQSSARRRRNGDTYLSRAGLYSWRWLGPTPKRPRATFPPFFLNRLIKKKGAAQGLGRPGACNEQIAMQQRNIEAS